MKDYNTFNSRTSFFEGNSRKVKFWTDKWCKNKPLWVSFPSLYALIISKEAWVTNL